MNIWKLLFLVGIVACNEIKDCQLDPNRDYVVVAFYNASDSLQKRVAFSRVVNEASPYYFYDGADTVTAMALPLNPDDSVTTYFLLTDSVNYELRMRYDHSFFIYAPACPPTFSYKNLVVATDSFDPISETDSIALISPLLTKDFPLNLEIYF